MRIVRRKELSLNMTKESIMNQAERNQCRFVVEIRVPGASVESCVESALGSVVQGIGYWANVGEDDDGTPTVWERDPPTKPETVEAIMAFHMRLDDAAITRGLALLAKKAPKAFGHILSEAADANDGDLLIQCALLGEIRYG